MAGTAKLILIGNLGRDPEMRYTPSGSAVTNFSVAVSRRFSGQDGEPREETEWFSVDCWNKLAETANQYLTKGRQVYIEGRIRLHSWDDRNTGEKRYQMRVTATDLVLLGQRGDQTGEAGGPGGATAASRPAAAEESEFDNMPF
jgi:single-strand DNA-binding protein